MNKKTKLIIDVIALIVYAIAANPAITGLFIHEWISLGIIVVFIVHCAVNYDGVLKLAKHRVDSGSILHLILDIALLIVFCVVTISGLMVSRHVLPLFGVVAVGYFFWTPVHAISAKVLLALLVLHVAAHYKWIISFFKKTRGKGMKMGIAENEWLNKAALYEILALAFLYTEERLSQALASGEFEEALEEISRANGVDSAVTVQVKDELSVYRGREGDQILHELRQEYTYLFVGAKKPIVSPFAGIWSAEEYDAEPMLFISKESMAVERFMRSTGVGQPKGTNEPLDHIASELEYLEYVCLVLAGNAAQPQDADIDITADVYFDFCTDHFLPFAHKFACAVIEKSRIPFYRAVARVLETTR